MEVLNCHGKALRGARILLLGLAYKPNVDDDRESPSYRLIEKLEHFGATVSYNDPYIPTIRPSREYSKYAGRTSVPITGDYDLVLIATSHDEYKKFDFASLHTPILDTRNIVPKGVGNVYKA
jgi:UDP-N-acetyl-D-glucosamine dehydrogenase